MSKNVILFGSSLNPMTQAHFAIIQKLSATYPDFEIRIVPVYKHPDPKALAPYADRVQMAREVVSNQHTLGAMKNVVVSDIEEVVYKNIYTEIALESVCATLGKTFVTYEQAADVSVSKQEYYSTRLAAELGALQNTQPELFTKCKENCEKLGVRTFRLLDFLKNNEKDTEFSFAFGGDTLAALLAGNWSNGNVIIRQCAQLIYVNRPGAEILEIKSTSPKKEVFDAIEAAIADGRDKFKPLAVFAANDQQLKNVSSTGFRELRDIDSQLVKTVPFEVLSYSYQHKLYGFAADFCSEAGVTAWYKSKNKITGTLTTEAEKCISEEVVRRKAAQSHALHYTEMQIKDKASANALVNSNNGLLANQTEEYMASNSTLQFFGT